eukprot:TRINITY_DN1165_c3_g1_i1.p1 TRINITY_DN1165_c3_g1~~TRINITY_DN1165_c3_g1_i1.p1  ORF type:complete len:1641 (+),score=441.76 TRINITY_DN1165_c3_g1_i1:37-4959(+)
MEKGKEEAEDVAVWRAKGCGMKDIEELMEMIRTQEAGGKDCVGLKKVLMLMLRGNCRGESQDVCKNVMQLIDVLEEVTERGYNALVSEDMMSIVPAMHHCASVRADEAAAVKSRCLEILSRTSSSSLAITSATDITSAVSMVWDTFDSCWDFIPSSVLKNGLLIVKALHDKIRFSAIPESVAGSYFKILCMGTTLPNIPLPMHTPETSLSPPSTLDEPSLSAPTAPVVLTFPLSSAALFCREALLTHMKHDLYYSLFHLRVFLQTHASSSPFQRLEPSATVMLSKDVSILRGSITALKYFIFPCKDRKEGGLSTKELLVVLTALRYCIATLDSCVACDVVLFIKRLLDSEVAAHLETQWHIVLDIISDLMQFYKKEQPEWLKEILCSCLMKVLSLKDRIELDMDRARALQLIDAFATSFEGKDSLVVSNAVIQHSLASGNLKMLSGMLNKYFVSDRFPAGVRNDCFRLFRNSNPHSQPGYLESLFKLICKDGTTFAGWDAAIGCDVITYLVELVCNLESTSLQPSTWTELVRICKDIVMQSTDTSEDPLNEKRWDICAAIVRSATSRLSTSASYCVELWNALLALLHHRKPKVRLSSLDYFLSLSCNEDFEVTEGTHRTEIAFVQAVSREPSMSIEAEFPASQLLDSLCTRLPHDHDCFQRILKLVRHLLTNNYFVVGNIAKSQAPLLRLASVMQTLLTEEGLAPLSKSGFGAPLQDIASTLVAMMPYVHVVGKDEMKVNLTKALASILKKLLEAQTLVPSGANNLLPAICDLFGSIHVALFQFWTADDLEGSSKLQEATVAVVKAVGCAVVKALAVTENMRTGTSSKEPSLSISRHSSSTLLEPVTVHNASHPPSPAAAREPASPNNVHDPAAPANAPAQVPGTPPPASNQEPEDYVAIHSKQYIVSLLSLIHSITTSPLVDDGMPCKVPVKVLHGFTEDIFKLLLEVTDTLKFNHRIHFLAHLVVAEMLQQNKRGMLPERTRQEVLRKLIDSVKSKKEMNDEGEKTLQLPMSRSKSSVEITTKAPTGSEAQDLIRATADLAWRLFYLGSADAYPQWDPLTEAFFAEGETQCWVAQGPHAPCVVTTTVGRSQHMLVTIRSLSSVCCWTCILHNKPTLPPYMMRTYSQPSINQLEPAEQAVQKDLPTYTAELVQQEHDDELRGLLRIESSASSLLCDRDDKEHGLDTSLTSELKMCELDESVGSPTSITSGERRKVQPLSEDDIATALTRESPTQHESPAAKIVQKFIPIADKRDKQASPMVREGSDDGATRLPLSASCDLTNPTPQRSPTPATRMMTPAATSLSVGDHAGLGEIMANTIHGAFILSMFRMTPAPQRLRWDDQLLRTLSALDKIPCKETHKIGLVYIDHGQYRPGSEEVKQETSQWGEREFKVLSNDSGSLRYQRFMCGLGKFKDLKIPREDPRESVKKGIWPHPCHYFGALDTARQQDGAVCLMSETPLHQVVYHVASIMNNERKADIRSTADKKKRHIGNDHVVITYCEDTTSDIDPFVLKNELNYINILVQPLADGFSRVSVHFRDCQENKDRSLQELLEEVGFGAAPCRGKGVVVHDDRLSQFVGSAALHASIATKSWRYERQQYASNWGDRLHRITQISARFTVKPEQRTTDDSLLNEYHAKAKQ